MMKLQERALDRIGRRLVDGTMPPPLISRLLSLAGLAPDDMEAWLNENEPGWDTDEVESEDDADPDVMSIALWRGYDDLMDRATLIARLHAAEGDEWQVERVIGAEAIAVRGVPSSRPGAVIVAAERGWRESSAADVAAMLEARGLVLTEWDWPHRSAVAAQIAPFESELRRKLATFLKVRPWDLELTVEWGVGRSGQGEPKVLTILRGPAISPEEKRRETWLEMVRTTVPAPEGTSWWVEDDAPGGRLILRRAEDPLGQVIDYPWDAEVSLTALPFAMDAAHRPVTLGLLEINTLLGGTPGGGKSGGLTALLCGISRLPNVALVGLDPKRVELAPWRSRFSRIARREEDATLVLEAVNEEMERRYEWLEERGLKKIGPEQLSASMPLIVVVIDELADLVSVGATREEKDADGQRATYVRRGIAKARAAGIVFITATQKPQSDVVPTALRDLIQLRVGYATTTPAMTETILGAGMAQTGGLSHEIPANLRGVCYIVNESSRTPVRARTYWVPDQQVLGIAKRTSHLRIDLPWMPEEIRGHRTASGDLVLEPVHAPAVELPAMSMSLEDLEGFDDQAPAVDLGFTLDDEPSQP